MRPIIRSHGKPLQLLPERILVRIRANFTQQPIRKQAELGPLYYIPEQSIHFNLIKTDKKVNPPQ